MKQCTCNGKGFIKKGKKVEPCECSIKKHNIDIWKKLLSEIPLHVDRLPVLALENKDGKRWVALDLDDFLNLYIEYYFVLMINHLHL